jgi:hypothetical protein
MKMSNLMTDLGTKVGSEFKAHRIRIEALENTSSQTSSLLANKADIVDVYTKTEIDTAIQANTVSYATIQKFTI